MRRIHCARTFTYLLSFTIFSISQGCNSQSGGVNLGHLQLVLNARHSFCKSPQKNQRSVSIRRIAILNRFIVIYYDTIRYAIIRFANKDVCSWFGFVVLSLQPFSPVSDNSRLNVDSGLLLITTTD